MGTQLITSSLHHFTTNPRSTHPTCLPPAEPTSHLSTTGSSRTELQTSESLPSTVLVVQMAQTPTSRARRVVRLAERSTSLPSTTASSRMVPPTRGSRPSTVSVDLTDQTLTLRARREDRSKRSHPLLGCPILYIINKQERTED